MTKTKICYDTRRCMLSSSERVGALLFAKVRTARAHVRLRDATIYARL